MSRDDAHFLDVLIAARLAIEFLSEHDEAAFRSSALLQSAVQHQLLILGEAVKRLSTEAREAHPGVPWREMAGMRDHLAHAYDAVDLGVVWEVVKGRLPELVAYLELICGPDI